MSGRRLDMAGPGTRRCGDVAERTMRRRWMIVVVVGAAAAWCAPLPAVGAADAAVAAATGPAIAAGSWRHAHEVPGLSALNASGIGFVLSVSCGSAGNCAVGGEYRDGSGHPQAF